VIDDVLTDINAVRGLTAEGEAPVRAAFSAARGPLVFATLAMLLGTLPFLFLGSVVTAFSRPLVLAFALAVLSSMVVSFLLTPTLATLLLRGRGQGDQDERRQPRPRLAARRPDRKEASQGPGPPAALLRARPRDRRSRAAFRRPYSRRLRTVKRGAG